MLVGNFIDGDSRVQKEARSAAEAGWDTYLIGRSPTGRREEYPLGAATVVRAAEGMAATRYRAAHPRRRLTGVIAYSSQELSKVKHQRQRLRQLDLAVERDLVQRKLADGANPVGAAAVKAGFAAHTVSVRARGYWIAARKQAFDRNYRLAQTERNGTVKVFLAKRGGDAAMRSAMPRLPDFEDSFGRVCDELKPDLIHANDAEMLGVAVRAVARARAAGRTVKVVYDAHEYFAGDEREDPAWGPVMAGQERKYISLADAVLSPIEGYADAMVAYHGIKRFPHRKPPVLVRNMPTLASLRAVGQGVPGVRADLKLNPETPLLVHPGSVTHVRGLETVVRALPALDGVHAALIVGRRDGYVAELSALAVDLGVADRFHLLDYVPSEELTGYLASATIGIDTLLHIPLHELTITTKFWSYISARLPVVASDVKATSALTRELGNGEVYVAGDVEGFVAATRKVLADPDRYTGVYTEETLNRFCWEGQVEAMIDLYAEVTGLRPVPLATGADTGAGAAAAESADAVVDLDENGTSRD